MSRLIITLVACALSLNALPAAADSARRPDPTQLCIPDDPGCEEGEAATGEIQIA